MSEITIEKLNNILVDLKKITSEEFSFPEPSLKLDLESRKNSPNRKFAYLHQQCSMHTEHFVFAQLIKLIYIIDGYINQASQLNPVGIYLFSRSLLELVAFVHEVSLRLMEFKEQEYDRWEGKGSKFFYQILRARYATSNKSKLTSIEELGIPSKHLKPMNIMNCIDGLIDSKYSNLALRYDEFCDYVHHNLSSNTISSHSNTITNSFFHSSGGGVLTKSNSVFKKYQYPCNEKAEIAIKATIEFISEAKDAFINITNSLPRSPYNEDQLIEMTGNKLGVRMVSPPKNNMNPLYYLTNRYKISPNDLCPCGSLKKYKLCCK